MKDSRLEILRSVLTCPTAPFREGRVADLVHRTAARLDHVRFRRDPDGNLLVRYRRGLGRARRPLVLQAHLDHPGFIALSQTRTGRVTARFIGRVDRAWFAGARVVFHGVDAVPARVESVRRSRESGELVATLDASGRVSPGTPGTWDLPPMRLRGRFLEARAADDLIGVAALLAVMEELAAEGPEVDVRFVFTRGEEAGFIGALGLIEGKRLPGGSRIVTVECTPALPDTPTGGGPILRVGDARTTFSPRLTGALHAVGRDLVSRGGGFRFRRRLMDGGVCESTPFSLFGFEAACLCLAIDSFHNMAPRGRIAPERVRLDDVNDLIRFLGALARADLDLDRRDAATRSRLADRYRRTAEELRT